MTRKRTGSRRDERWWQALLAEQASTKERIADLCARHGVTPWSFYSWRKRLRGKPQPVFREVELGMVNEYEVRCRNGRSVVVRGAVTPAVLASILSIAEGDGL